jgi:hypothetical protein
VNAIFERRSLSRRRRSIRHDRTRQRTPAAGPVTPPGPLAASASFWAYRSTLPRSTLRAPTPPSSGSAGAARALQRLKLVRRPCRGGRARQGR